ncbi:MAG: response regulator [Bryobacteraceae bacterium]
MSDPETANHAKPILVVDDDPQVLRLIGEVLRGAGYNVLLADGGWNAIQTFEKALAPPALLVTDVIMPDLTGPVLAARLRRMLPELKVLFISGFHDTSLVQHFVREKGFALLPKPFTAEGLLRTIEQSLA